MTKIKTALALVIIFLFFISIAKAQSPPSLPASFYGSLTINNQPAPIGIVIIAKIDNEDRGSITTSNQGSYGGPSGLDPKLIVTGSDGDQGKEIKFFINGKEVDQSATWQSGDVSKLDLSVQGLIIVETTTTTTSSNGGGGGSSCGGGGGGATSIPRPEPLVVSATDTNIEEQSQQDTTETGLEGITGSAVQDQGRGSRTLGLGITATIIVIGLIVYFFSRRKE